MRIQRDYSQPFFRQPNRHRARNLSIAALLGILLGFGVYSQWDSVERLAGQLTSAAATATPVAAERAGRAAALAHAGDYAGAEKLLSQIVKERPETLAYRYEHGRALLDLGRFDDALDAARQILDQDASDARGFALKAAALVGADNAAEAIPVALTGLDLSPGFAPLYAALTRAYVDAQRWPDALETGERGLELNPDDADLARAYAYALQSVGAYDDAAARLERAIELRPAYLPTQFELAALLLARDENERAIEHYERILSLDTRNARAMLRLCLAYRKIGQFSRALGFCEDSVAHDDSDAEALFQLAMLYYRERRFTESRDTFQKCVAREAPFYDLSCRYRLGLSHYYTGDCTSGWVLLSESLLLAAAANSEALANIELGLEEISRDPACIAEASATQSF